MYDNAKHIKKLSLRFLLDELLVLDELGPSDWEAIYRGYLKRMTKLRHKYAVLAYFFRAVELRSDYITANKVFAKLFRHFDELFERLPGKQPYYIPSAAGRELFLALINPLDREEVEEETERAVALVRQLSLSEFLENRGVRV